MNAFKAVEVLRKYSKCPECKKDIYNPVIEDDVAKLKCECGWKITVDENGKKVLEAKDKYEKLTNDLKEAYQEALLAKTNDDGGTANMDSTFLKLKGWREGKVLQAIKASGLYCRCKSQWIGTGYFIDTGNGQGNDRTRVRDKFIKILKSKGYEALRFDRMD